MSAVTDCKLWTGPFSRDGYGICQCRRAHRIAYELENGPIPDGYVVHHTCHNKACINPAHLVAMTRSEHSRQPGHNGDLKASKTHCPQGHEYTPGNTIIDGHSGGRRCATCRAEEAAARRVTTGPTNLDLHEANVCRQGHPQEGRKGRNCRECARKRAKAARDKYRAENPLPARPKQTACRNGHVYDEVGVYEYRGKRYCMECRREADRRRHSRNN